MFALRLPLLCALALIAQAAFVQAQGTSVGFKGLRQDTSAPVEVTADSLTVDQAAGGATFSGNVLVVQGEMRLQAAEVKVRYGASGEGIEKVEAKGGVTVVTAAEAAQSRQAHYDITTGTLVMEGDVVMTQGGSTLAGERLEADLTQGSGRMSGRVRTTFQPSARP